MCVLGVSVRVCVCVCVSECGHAWGKRVCMSMHMHEPKCVSAHDLKVDKDVVQKHAE